jgi:hypothetical protein
MILYPAPPEFTSMLDTCYLGWPVLSFSVKQRNLFNERATLDCYSQHTRNHRLTARSTLPTHTTAKTGTELMFTTKKASELNAVPTFLTRWNLQPSGHKKDCSVIHVNALRVSFLPVNPDHITSNDNNELQMTYKGRPWSH